MLLQREKEKKPLKIIQWKSHLILSFFGSLNKILIYYRYFIFRAQIWTDDKSPGTAPDWQWETTLIFKVILKLLKVILKLTILLSGDKSPSTAVDWNNQQWEKTIILKVILCYASFVHMVLFKINVFAVI